MTHVVKKKNSDWKTTSNSKHITSLKVETNGHKRDFLNYYELREFFENPKIEKIKSLLIKHSLAFFSRGY